MAAAITASSFDTSTIQRHPAMIAAKSDRTLRRSGQNTDHRKPQLAVIADGTNPALHNSLLDLTVWLARPWRGVLGYASNDRYAMNGGLLWH